MKDDVSLVDELTLTDPWVAAITPKRIGDALEGFALPYAEGWGLERLTLAIQRMANAGRGEPPQGEAAAQKELSRLAGNARQLHKAIARMGDTAEFAVFWELVRHRQALGQDGHTDYDLHYKPTMLHPVETIANLLARAASQLGSQRRQTSRWRQRHGKEQRIGFAIYLAPIFGEAFDTPVSATNWGKDFGKEQPWPDFFRRIYKELFPQARRLNLAEVLQEAARQAPHVEAMRRWLDEQDAIRAKNNRE